MPDNITEKFNKDHQSWPAVEEMCKIAGADSIVPALKTMKLMTDKDTLDDVTCVNPKWERGGGESYILPCRITTTDHKGVPQEKVLMLKACIKMATPDDPERPSRQLLERRQDLGSLGIKTPTLYGYRNAGFLEDFIEQDIRDGLADDGNREAILEGAARTYGTLARGGYAPLHRFLTDLRWDGENLVCIDFGDDLGAKGDEADLAEKNWKTLVAEAHNLLGIEESEIEKYKNFYDETAICNTRMADQMISCANIGQAIKNDY